MAVIANQFVIRDIIPGSPDFMYSDNIFDIASRHGLWDKSSGKPLDFLKTYAPPRAHSPYATRRVWRVFNIVAPSIVLPGDTDAYGSDYPFSIKVDRPITPQELMNINVSNVLSICFSSTVDQVFTCLLFSIISFSSATTTRELSSI